MKKEWREKMRRVGFGKKQIGVILDEDFATLVETKLKKKEVHLSLVVRSLLEMWLKGKVTIKREI